MLLPAQPNKAGLQAPAQTHKAQSLRSLGQSTQLTILWEMPGLAYSGSFEYMEDALPSSL